MEVLSFSLGVASILPLVASAIIHLKAYHDSVIGHAQSIDSLITELQTLRSSLESLDDFLRSENSKPNRLETQQIAVLQSCSAACEVKLTALCDKLQRGREGKMGRYLWPFTEKEHKKTVQELQSFTLWMQFALSVNGCKLLSRMSDGVLEILGQQLDQFKLLERLEEKTSQLQEAQQDHARRDEAVRRAEVLDWISATNHGQRHHTIVSSRAANTGGWILCLEEYLRWRDNASCSPNVLFCHGVEGSGKTNLA